MKIIILGLVLIFSLTVNAQENKGEFNETFKVVQSKDYVFSNILVWTAQTFNDANSVIKLKDKDSGVIVIKGNIKSEGFITSFTMTFRVSDSECTLNIKDWQETQYEYSYDVNNCYTNSCRKNIEKWKVNVNQLGLRFIKEINQEVFK
jgi:hypothetical protein